MPRTMPTLARLACAALAAVPAGAVADNHLTLTFVESHRIHDSDRGFKEPSGLALSEDGSFLWSVSDDTRAVFRLSLDGEPRREKAVDAPMKGLEGIALDAARNRLLMVREERNEVIAVDLDSGETVLRRELAEMDGYDSIAGLFGDEDTNKGLEGITVDAATGNVFVVKEGLPRMMLALSPDLDRILAARKLEAKRGFRVEGVSDDDLDVSGLAHDPDLRMFWIVSDRGRSLFLYDWDEDAAVAVPLLWRDDDREKEVRNAEGVAIDRAAGRLYVVSDDGRTSRLYVYSLR